ncbi:S8 family peptidase [Paenibacillus sp. UNC499MF]|uniref:S8 family peptidase n=1 Tax=Paenibacillus sp. UNC499MF TaxID=1502751 RepID=UPI0008A04453|nr:S8 family peptidase [Paenibacillus sp. UNC499MF]SEG17424.1 thermitase [Paenibacillus sp. UNC499MF]
MTTWIATLAFIAAAAFVYLIFRIKKQPKEPHRPFQLIVKFKPETPEELISKLHKKYKCKVLEQCSTLGHQVLFTKQPLLKTIKKYEKHDVVEYAELNYIYQAFDFPPAAGKKQGKGPSSPDTEAFAIPNDPYFSLYQYGPQKISAPSAWDVAQSGSSIVIAVLDTGVELTHPDLAAHLVAGYDYVDNDSNPSDGNGHGTHVAGIAAAVTNNGIGIAGVAPLASIQPIRVLDNAGNGTVSNISNAIIYASFFGAQVINLSLGSPYSSTTLQYALDYAWGKGSVIVASAGNDGSMTPNYPAAYSTVISVASTDSADNISSFSNRGSWVQVAAPGTTILSTFPGSSYAYLSGTSMSAPHVSGLAALLAGQGRTNAQIRDAILFNADPIAGTGTYWVYGRVNADRAVRS